MKQWDRWFPHLSFTDHKVLQWSNKFLPLSCCVLVCLPTVIKEMWEEQTPVPQYKSQTCREFATKFLLGVCKKGNLIKQVSSETCWLRGGKVLVFSEQRTNYPSFVRAVCSKWATWGCGWDGKMKVFQTFGKKAGFSPGLYFLNQVKQHRLCLESAGEGRNLIERAEAQEQIKLQELGPCFLKFCKPIPVTSVWVMGCSRHMILQGHKVSQWISEHLILKVDQERNVNDIIRCPGTNKCLYRKPSKTGMTQFGMQNSNSMLVK